MNWFTSRMRSSQRYSFSMFSADWLSRLMGFATPPTARFWIWGVLAPRIAVACVAFRWYSSAWR